MSLLGGGVLAASTLVAALSSGMVDFRSAYTPPSWQPSGRAFATWGVIFGLSVWTSVDLAVGAAPSFANSGSLRVSDGGSDGERFALGLSLAYALCTAWAFAFARKARRAAAALLLAAFATCLYATLAYASPRAHPLHDVTGCVFAGWLGVASALGVAIAVDAEAEEDTVWVGYVFFAGLCGVAVAFARPVLLLPALWALLWWEDEGAASGSRAAPSASRAASSGSRAAARMLVTCCVVCFGAAALSRYARARAGG